MLFPLWLENAVAAAQQRLPGVFRGRVRAVSVVVLAATGALIIPSFRPRLAERHFLQSVTALSYPARGIEAPSPLSARIKALRTYGVPAG